LVDLANGAINSGVIKYTAEYEKEVKLKKAIQYFTKI
jgi:hypothetical protein